MQDDNSDPPPPDPAAFRFDFDDVVRVVSDNPELAEINGDLGAICGKGEDETDPGYAVFIYRLQRVWCVDEPDLQPTGQRDVRPPPDTVIRVRVDEDGRGEIVGARKL